MQFPFAFVIVMVIRVYLLEYILWMFNAKRSPAYVIQNEILVTCERRTKMGKDPFDMETTRRVSQLKTARREGNNG
jgi:hypothetical protein